MYIIWFPKFQLRSKIHVLNMTCQPIIRENQIVDGYVRPNHTSWDPNLIT